MITFVANFNSIKNMENDDLNFDLEKRFEKYSKERKIGTNFMFLNDVRFLNDDCEAFQNEYYIDIFLQEGSLSFELRAERQTLVAPAVLFVPREEKISFLDYSENILINIFIIKNKLRESLLDEFVKDMSVSKRMKLNPMISVSKNDVSPFIHYVQGVRRIVSDTKNPFRLEAVRYYIKSFYYQYFYKVYPFSKNNNFGTSNNFLELVECHFLKERNVNFYAEILGLSRGHLDFILKKEFGNTAKAIIEERIARESKHLLIDSNESIGVIAKKMGFTTIELFSRFFKRVTGKSPSKYRK